LSTAHYTPDSDSDDTPSDGEGDTRHGRSPTRDTSPSHQNDTQYESSSSEDEAPVEDNQDDSDPESPFRNDDDSPTNQSPSPGSDDDPDLVSTEKRRLAQIRAEKDSDERARLREEFDTMVGERRAREELGYSPPESPSSSRSPTP
jgi:hypothetical protein